MAERVIWTEAAKTGRRNILKFWTERTGNRKYSRRLSKEFNGRIDHLKKYPELGKPTDTEKVRTTSCGHFSFFYLNRTDTIVILGIYDTRRDPELIVAEIKAARNYGPDK